MRKIIKGLLSPRLIRWIRDTLEQLRALVHRLRWSVFAFSEGDIGVGTFDGFKVAYRLNSVDREVLRHSFDQDIFLTSIPEYTLPADAVILDIGAHIGTFSILAARKAPQGRIYAIEASLDTFNLLRANVSMNGLRNIVVDHLALNDRPSTITH